jgi:hypothetical protein
MDDLDVAADVAANTPERQRAAITSAERGDITRNEGVSGSNPLGGLAIGGRRHGRVPRLAE